MNKYAIIVAGGKGLRMGGEIPKQFLPVGGKPILMRTIEAFKKEDQQTQIILVLPKDQQEYWHKLCADYGFNVQHKIADGGETRFHSVKNGLMTISAEQTGLVAVHDGVRPFVSTETIRNTFEMAEKTGNAVPVTDSVDSVRQTDTSGNSKSLERKTIKLVQTPQIFDIALLKRAYEQEFDEKFTDDASVVEKAGERINLAAGNRENIKITTPFDLAVAEILVNK